MTSVDWQHGTGTSSSDLSLRHQRFPSKPARRRARPSELACVSSTGVPSGRFAVSRRSVICMRLEVEPLAVAGDEDVERRLKRLPGRRCVGAVTRKCVVQPDLDVRPVARRSGCRRSAGCRSSCSGSAAASSSAADVQRRAAQRDARRSTRVITGYHSVVTHAAPATLRIVTYNIHRCRGMDRRTRPDRIAAVLRDDRRRRRRAAGSHRRRAARRRATSRRSAPRSAWDG